MDDNSTVAELVREARQAVVSGNINLALNALCQAARREPTVEVWLLLAEAYEKLGRGNIYIAYLSMALSQMPKKPAELMDKLRACTEAFLDANPLVRDVQRISVKNPNAPRIKREREEFFRYINAGNSRGAFKLGMRQYEERRVDPLIQGVWCSIAARNGQSQMALNSAFAAFVREPHDKVALTNIADILSLLRKVQPALDFALAAVNIAPKLPVAWINLAAAFENLGSHWEAAKACREAIKLNPKDGLAWTNLGNSLKNSGRSSEATEAYRRSVVLDPDNVVLWSNLLFGILYDEKATQEDASSEAFRFGEHWEPKFKPISHNGRLRGEIPERLRVGFVSADIRSHPVAYFFEPLLEHLDRDKFEVFIYDNYVQEDIVTRRFKQFADKWQNISAMKDPDFVKLVVKDKIDILVDMSGHTGRNRLLAFAQKPAPVQVTWLGHPATTGLRRMDWRITDKHSDPEGAENFYTEQLHRFECSICYAPLVKNPERRGDPIYHVCPSPALLNGYVTFGCCNNVAKINRDVISCWSKLLKKVINSKLLIESPGLSQIEFRKRIISQFEENGISEGSLLLFSRDSDMQYVRYHEIDIALDPFPYGGGTTSCDLLWMGVPLVSLISQGVMGRSGDHILSAIGHTEWLAENEDHYIDIAARLASDITSLNAVRFSLRGEMERSDLMNGEKFGEKFGSALLKFYDQARCNAS